MTAARIDDVFYPKGHDLTAYQALRALGESVQALRKIGDAIDEGGKRRERMAVASWAFEEAGCPYERFDVAAWGYIREGDVYLDSLRDLAREFGVKFSIRRGTASAEAEAWLVLAMTGG
jgi:hypothetical protein